MFQAVPNTNGERLDPPGIHKNHSVVQRESPNKNTYKSLIEDAHLIPMECPHLPPSGLPFLLLIYRWCETACGTGLWRDEWLVYQVRRAGSLNT